MTLATLDEAELWPVVSLTITVKECGPTDRTVVVKAFAAPCTVPIGRAGVDDAESKMSVEAISAGVSTDPSVRVVGAVQVRDAVLTVSLL